MLSSASHAIFGTTNIGRSIDFLRRFGFERIERSTLPAIAAQALYGLERPLNEAVLKVPARTGALNGWIRLVETPHPSRPSLPLDCGPRVLDVYTRDLDRSLDLAREMGAPHSPRATYRIGPLTIEEAIVEGPVGEKVTPVFINRRRPSLLDRNPDCLHSEVHGLVWIVDSMSAALSFWTDQAWLNPLLDASVVAPSLGQLLDLPHPELPIRIVLATDESQAPIRLELVELAEKGVAEYQGMPLHAGLHAVGFSVPHLEPTLELLSAAQMSRIVEVDSSLHRRARAVTGLAPGQVRFELWEEAVL